MKENGGNEKKEREPISMRVGSRETNTRGK
jgi:hypothetical protein